MELKDTLSKKNILMLINSNNKNFMPPNKSHPHQSQSMFHKKKLLLIKYKNSQPKCLHPQVMISKTSNPNQKLSL